MVFNATFNNISVISWWSVLLVEETGETCHKSLKNFFRQCCIEYISPWTGFKLTTLVVIGTDYTGSCKFQLPYDHDHNGPFNTLTILTITLI
jgi:hypothetical protein